MTPAAELAELWRERDRRCSRRLFQGRPHRLSENEAEAIRENREKEARTLTSNERRVALSILDRWTPPEVGR